MNKKILYTAVTALALVISTGCSKKMPVAIPGSHLTGNGSVGGSIDGDVVPANAINAGSLDGNSNVNGNSKTSFQAGKISSKGKYLGSDGVSKSGFKMLYFASDAYTLDDDQMKRLMSDLPQLKAKAASGKLLVEGNCDEFGTDEYNHALGLKRAKAVKTLLVSSGIDASKISTVSYGESNPTCTVNKPACHAKNRRAEINTN